jgi:hypothetical protein
VNEHSLPAKVLVGLGYRLPSLLSAFTRVPAIVLPALVFTQITRAIVLSFDAASVLNGSDIA